ncbi:MAG: hypothetical protein AAB229_10940 [Candidatus Hydrogenedentota bacterium]
MTQALDLNGILISVDGEKIPCKLVNMTEDKLEIYSIDPVNTGARLQLIIPNPRLQCTLIVDTVEVSGDSHILIATPLEGTAHIRAKILEQKVRGLIR